MIRLVYPDDPLALRFQVEYSNWELARSFPANSFESPKASSAPRIPFYRPDLLLPTSGPKPAAKKGKPVKTK